MSNRNEVIEMNTKIRKKQENVSSEELQNHLCAQIEAEWIKNRNADLVDELAFRHPELATELYEFFALLVEIELEEDENGGVEDSEKQLSHWLQTEGFEIARQAAADACQGASTSPTDSNFTEQAKARSAAGSLLTDSDAPPDNVIPYDTFLRKAQKREGLKAREFAKEINVPLPLIFLAEENFDPQFDPLRDELSDRYARRFNLDRREARESFRPVAMAAKTGKTTMTRDGAETMIKKLPKSEREYWLNLLGL